jgi:hypothetical protein
MSLHIGESTTNSVDQNREVAACITLRVERLVGACTHESPPLDEAAVRLALPLKCKRDGVLPAVSGHWRFFSIAVVHGVRSSEAAVDSKGLETLASMSAVPRLPAVQSRRCMGKSLP